MEVQRRLLNREGEEVSGLRQGQEVTVQLTLRAVEGAQDHMAIIDLLPGGFEVLRDSVAVDRRWMDYVDVREDRLVFYGRLERRARILTYRAKATAAGSFVLPALYAESMYDPQVYAAGVPGRVEVSQHAASGEP
ncbi:MAG: hypothetical protein ACP5KN_05525 [Armatimonadota bacterium]